MQTVSSLSHPILAPTDFTTKGLTPAGLVPNSALLAMIEHQRQQTPLWQLLVQLLPDRDVDTEFYALDDLAPLLGVKRRVLVDHARDLWPSHEGQWRLNYAQAVSLIRRVAYVGRKLPSREDLEARLQRLQK